MNWKKYLLAFSSIAVLVASEQIIHACADFDSYDTYPSFFGNKATQTPAYTPFFYVSDDLYYNDYNDEHNPGPEQVNKTLMLQEWQEYTRKESSVKDIETILYHTGIDAIQALDRKVPDSISANTFAQWLSKAKNKPALQYLNYAKACEINATAIIADWDTTRAKPVASNMMLMEEGIGLRKKTKDDFLKMKYNFQILRMAFYDQQYDKVLSLYEELLGSSTDNSVAYARCIGFKAGAYYKKKEKAKAGYYYSKMFAGSDAYKSEAMISYEWSRTTYDPDKGETTEDFTDAIYKLCQNDKERAVVTVMNALRNVGDALPDIEKAYQLDPAVAGLDVLLNREINKVEENYFSSIVYSQNKLPNTSYWYYDIRNYNYNYGEQSQAQKDSVTRTYTSYLSSLNRFAEKMAAERKNGTPAFWHLSSAYIAYMMQDKAKMNAAMAAAKASGMQPREQGLYNVIEILAVLKNAQSLTPAVEAQLLPKLQALNTLAIKDHDADKTFRNIMQHLVAGQYLQQKDTIKAVYAMAHANSYDSARNTFYTDESFKDIQGSVLDAMSIPQLNNVQAFAANTQKSGFDQWLVKGTYYTPENLKELEGTKYIREYKFKEAATIFAQINPSKKFPSPFTPQINDIVEADETEINKGYNKLSFSKRMAELQEIIAKNPNDAGALYGYAVALYNISYYGKASNMVDYTRNYTSETAYYITDGWKQLSRPFQEYYGVYTAEQYFNKAAAVATDPEVKAKAIWGAAKCWQKRCPVTPENRYDYDNGYFLNALKNPHFQKLQSGYNQTRYMQTVYNTCDYYGSYIRRNR
ncbi:hypothetical protein D3C71_193840 [compost metagenome]